MVTENETINGQWSLRHAATVGNTNVVLTSRAVPAEWAITSGPAPSGDLQGHILEEDRDRGFVLSSGESLYTRGNRDAIVVKTTDQ